MRVDDYKTNTVSKPKNTWGWLGFIPWLLTLIAVLNAIYFFVQSQGDQQKLEQVQERNQQLVREKEDAMKVEVAPTPTAAPSPSPASEIIEKKPFSVLLLNGTSVVGLTFDFDAELDALDQEFTDIERDNAVSRDYEKSFLVINNTDISKQAEVMADELSLATVELPEVEQENTADVVIILGADQIE